MICSWVNRPVFIARSPLIRLPPTPEILNYCRLSFSMAGHGDRKGRFFRVTGVIRSPRHHSLVVVVMTPFPVIPVLRIAAPFPINVIAVRFMLPLDVICLLSRSPRIDLTMRGTSGAKERDHQHCCKRKPTKSSHFELLLVVGFPRHLSEDATRR